MRKSVAGEFSGFARSQRKTRHADRIHVLHAEPGAVEVRALEAMRNRNRAHKSVRWGESIRVFARSRGSRVNGNFQLWRPWQQCC